MNPGKLGILTAAFLLLAGFAPMAAHANDIANPGFEDPITFDGPPFVGFWEGFSGGPGAVVANSGVMPRSGVQHLLLEIVDTPNSFAGVFQDIPNLTPGQDVSYSGWHMTPSDPLDLGVEIRVEWRDSVNDVEISRTPNLIPIPTGEYEQFELTATVPDGADTGRLIYAVQTFGGGPTSTGTVYVDDLSFPSEDPTPVEETTWGQVRNLYR